MNAVGRQTSGSGSSMHHLHRQYSTTSRTRRPSGCSPLVIHKSSINLIIFSNSPLVNSKLHAGSLIMRSSDFKLYATRMSRQSHRNGSDQSPPESRTPPPIASRSSSMRRNGDDRVSPSELSPGLLDIHSFDTELLPELTPRSQIIWATPQFNLTNNLRADREKKKGAILSVAKSKVVVRKRPLNKKEFAKKEVDIITIEPHSNALTVHETKLQVSNCQESYVNALATSHMPSLRREGMWT
ncbi:hypothetical protein DVH24_029272 [Malus domestica]|uniref:Uncharacterized protein n=1 Tax=Malus domestica TaxID=3750 RepID=A0A498HZH7_MALDO|nr:hypothetical protein DVH24_029272 [Malus domestica]